MDIDDQLHQWMQSSSKAYFEDDYPKEEINLYKDYQDGDDARIFNTKILQDSLIGYSITYPNQVINYCTTLRRYDDMKTLYTVKDLLEEQIKNAIKCNMLNNLSSDYRKVLNFINFLINSED